MFLKRSFELLAVLALMGVAAFTINAAIATSTVVSNGGNVVTERQRSESLTGGDLKVSPLRRNIHERAAERADANAANTVNTSISPLRRNIHERAWERADANVGNTTNAMASPLRRNIHELLAERADANVGSSSFQPNLSDYALRHPELTQPATPDLSDWYLRHRDEIKK